MKHSPVRRCIVLLVLLLGLPLAAQAQVQSKKIITLGADLNPDQRKALLQRFGANEANDKILTISTDETRNAMQAIIPLPAGYTSVSSTALSCLSPGAGLHVTTENIQKVSAAMYASALLTAGIGDADLIVAAPQDAPAEGMSALTGVFKGFTDPVCNRGELNPTRRDLAFRQLALTADLANATGGDYTKAADLMLRAQQVLVREKNNPDAAYPIVDGVQNDTGIKLPAEQRKAVAELLAAMGQAKIDWGTYASGWDFQKISGTEVRMTAKNIAGATDGSNTAGQTYTGTVASTDPLHIMVPGDLPALQLNANSVKVIRNDQQAKLSDIQPSDSVIVSVGPNNVVQQIVAQSAAASTGRTVRGSATSLTAGMLSMDTPTGVRRFTSGGVPVVRNGKTAKASDIQVGDTVVVQLDPNGQPTLIQATSPTSAGRLGGLFGSLRRYWWLCLIPLLLLLLLPILRRRRETLLVTPGRRTIVDPDEEDLLG